MSRKGERLLVCGEIILRGRFSAGGQHLLLATQEDERLEIFQVFGGIASYDRTHGVEIGIFSQPTMRDRSAHSCTYWAASIMRAR